MKNTELTVELVPAVNVALQATMEREGINASLVVNRALAQYAASTVVPFDKSIVMTTMDGSTIRITRTPPE
jgi:antitoxin component of RelBE/YafQ-DinJ toxin-antitoxin module